MEVESKLVWWGWRIHEEGLKQVSLSEEILENREERGFREFGDERRRNDGVARQGLITCQPE
jgi:hypothetical protein